MVAVLAHVGVNGCPGDEGSVNGSVVGSESVGGGVEDYEGARHGLDAALCLHCPRNHDLGHVLDPIRHFDAAYEETAAAEVKQQHQ